MTELEAGIITADGAALAAFYVTGLGFTEDVVLTFAQGTVRRMSRDQARLKLYQPADGALAPPRPEPWHRDRGFGYAALQVDDIAAVVTAAVSHGASVIAPITPHRPGARFALLADPDGNVWEILEE